jgi:hypothetical protein
VRTGRLWRVYNGVYGVGHWPVTPHARAMAAVLACGPRAALSHVPGGALWEVGLRWPPMMEVTAPGQRQRKGIKVHRSQLDRRDITRHYGIPVTTLARTLLDLAEVLDTPSRTRAVNEARLRRKSTLADLAELLTRSPGRATRRLKPFIQNPTGPTRSEFEDAFLRFARRNGLPTPRPTRSSPAMRSTSSSDSSGWWWSWTAANSTRTRSKQTASAMPPSSMPAFPSCASRGKD